MFNIYDESVYLLESSKCYHNEKYVKEDGGFKSDA